MNKWYKSRNTKGKNSKTKNRVQLNSFEEPGKYTCQKDKTEHPKLTHGQSQSLIVLNSKVMASNAINVI